MKFSLTNKEESEFVRMLQRVPLFSSLERKQLKMIAETFTERSYDSGEVIEEDGTVGFIFYLISEGSVDVRKGKRALAKLGRGQYFGEMSLLDKQPRSATIIAREPTKCLLMTAANFMAFLQTQPKLTLGIMKELARRLRDTDLALSE